MQPRWTVLTALTLSVFTAHAQSTKQPLEQWQTYAQSAPVSLSNLKENQAIAVFYRLDDGANVPVNVYVNGRYHASLLPNTFSAQPVCAAKQVFGLAVDEIHGFENIRNQAERTLPVGEVAHFRVQADANGQPEWVAVSAEVARAEMGKNKMVTQTHSRAVSAHCEAPVLQTENFSTSAIFGFNQYAYEGIAPEAHEPLMKLSQKINNLGAERIQKVLIAGHSDPEGSPDYNLDLSQKRALTIQAALQKMGGVSVPMEAVGFGAKSLKVDNCATLHPKNAKARHECNQPNRRVEITVYGRQ